MKSIEKKKKLGEKRWMDDQMGHKVVDTAPNETIRRRLFPCIKETLGCQFGRSFSQNFLLQLWLSPFNSFSSNKRPENISYGFNLHFRCIEIYKKYKKGLKNINYSEFPSQTCCECRPNSKPCKYLSLPFSYIFLVLLSIHCKAYIKSI